MANFDNIVSEIEKLTALQLSELVKTLEEKFGVSATAPMMMAAAPGGGAVAAEEKTEFSVELTDSGASNFTNDFDDVDLVGTGVGELACIFMLLFRGNRASSGSSSH